MLPYSFLIAGVILAALTLYALTGGADYGGGVWDLFALGPRAQAQRDLIAEAIAPIWEANHVWLIIVIVLLFVAFPVAFAAIMTALHIPLVIMLVGIVLRGSAFTFRAYGIQSRARPRRLGSHFRRRQPLHPHLPGRGPGRRGLGPDPGRPGDGDHKRGLLLRLAGPLPLCPGDACAQPLCLLGRGLSSRGGKHA